jgi:ABC-type polysaccharide/polyol phosphate transport system ATPase subunit
MATAQAQCQAGPDATVRLVTNGETAVVPPEKVAAEAAAEDEHSRRPVTVRAQNVWKTFRLPHDRPYTLKQRALHPRRSRAATQLHALRDVSFEVQSGEFFGIIGRNGSGKSTLLKCLAGIYRPGRGEITVGGRVSPFIELGVGFNQELTARDNVVVNAALLGIPKAESLARFPEVIRFAELEQFVDLKLKNYSSGMQVRLGFSSTIQADAEIYLVDEVLAVGDARFQEKCFEVFRRFKRDGRTVVYVTHDLSSVERFCDRALLLEGGEVAAIGDPRDVIHEYRLLNLERERGAQAHREGGKRWGDRAAEVDDTWFEDENGVRTDVLVQGQAATFVAHIRFRDEMESPVFGTIIKNEQGHHVLVTNTLFDAVETGMFQPGEEALYKVRFEVVFSDGRYTACPAIAHQDAQRFADWWEDALSVLVRADRYTSGMVDLPHDVQVERIPGTAAGPELNGPRQS